MKEYDRAFCKYCWNPVHRIKYKIDRHGNTPQIGRGATHVWTHAGGGSKAPVCGKSPLTDDDVRTTSPADDW